MHRLLAIVAATVMLCGSAPFSRPVAAQAPDRPVTLAEALAQARQQSPARQASAARADAADLARTLSGRLPNPVTEVRWENWAPGLHDTLPYDSFATITQPFELGGKRAARRGVATAAAEGARAALTSTERGVDTEVARRFLAVVRERDRSRLLTEHAEGLAALVRILERRVAEGVTAEADLRKIETEFARVDTDAALAAIRANRELAGLAAIVGWSPAPAPEALERPALAPPQDGEQAIAAALERRPDVQLAAARLEAARQALRFEQARRVPDVNVTGGMKRTGGNNTGVVAIVVPVPLFDRNQPALALASGQVRADELELQQTRRLAEGEARAALIAARELARRSTNAADRLVGPATTARFAARSAFESGAGDLLRLVDAERVWADARVVVNDLALDALTAAIDARLALGEDTIP